MIERDVRPCPQHRGEPAHNCGCCRSERIANPIAEPDRIPVRRERHALQRTRRQARKEAN